MTDVLGIDSKEMSCGEETNGYHFVIIGGCPQSYNKYDVNVVLCDFILYVFNYEFTSARVHVYINKLIWDGITLYMYWLLNSHTHSNLIVRMQNELRETLNLRDT